MSPEIGIEDAKTVVEDAEKFLKMARESLNKKALISKKLTRPLFWRPSLNLKVINHI